jgi:hypothetical protein
MNSSTRKTGDYNEFSTRFFRTRKTGDNRVPTEVALIAHLFTASDFVLGLNFGCLRTQRQTRMQHLKALPSDRGKRDWFTNGTIPCTCRRKSGTPDCFVGRNELVYRLPRESWMP